VGTARPHLRRERRKLEGMRHMLEGAARIPSAAPHDRHKFDPARGFPRLRATFPPLAPYLYVPRHEPLPLTPHMHMQHDHIYIAERGEQYGGATSISIHRTLEGARAALDAWMLEADYVSWTRTREDCYRGEGDWMRVRREPLNA